MSMSKQDFIALADVVRDMPMRTLLTPTGKEEHVIDRREVIDALASFCRSQNPRFMRDRWLSYIAGECGPNGGAVKKPAAGINPVHGARYDTW